MARLFSESSQKILKFTLEKNGVLARELFNSFGKTTSYKDFYNNVYRLMEQGLLEKKPTNLGASLYITKEGKKLAGRLFPEKDGIWKLVIFDIPEKYKYVRSVLRAKLKSLHFKKWQNSIWVSPYLLDPEIEEEINKLGEKFFVRLIKTTNINNTSDLENLFK